LFEFTHTCFRPKNRRSVLKISEQRLTSKEGCKRIIKSHEGYKALYILYVEADLR